MARPISLISIKGPGDALRVLWGAPVRLGMFLEAYRSSERLLQYDPTGRSSKEIVDFIFSFAGGFLAPYQLKDEIVDLVDEVRARQPRILLELGTACGGTLFLWSRIAHPEALLISVDLPNGPFGGQGSRFRLSLLRRYAREGQTLHLLRADSHAEAARAQVADLLRGKPADFLFIDADHTERGVRADYEMYGPFVAPGGLIAFHDIEVASCGVKVLWEELRDTCRTREILHGNNPFGIGVLYKNAPTTPN